MTKIIVKTLDGQMGFSEVPDDIELLTIMKTEDNKEYEFVDWCGQFNGPSIPVYQELKND